MDILQLLDFIDEEDIDQIEQYHETRTKRIRIDPFECYDDVIFKKKFSFSKDFVKNILDIVKDDLPHDPRGGTIDHKIRVACALRYWARHQFQDESGDMHGISQQAVSKITKNIAEALAKKAHLFINMPMSMEDQENTMKGFKSICGFPAVLGVIDCTNTRIRRVGGDISEAHVNRKGHYSVSTQIVCDSNLKIRDIDVRWQGGANDSRIFNESALKERFENGEFCGRLLADSGYACTSYLFTPVPNPSNQKEEAYNTAHIRTRNTIEQCFGLWKQRFRCLLRGMYMKQSTAKTTIVALAVLHNIAIDMNETINIRRYIRRRIRRRAQIDTANGAIARRNFINSHF